MTHCFRRIKKKIAPNGRCGHLSDRRNEDFCDGETRDKWRPQKNLKIWPLPPLSTLRNPTSQRPTPVTAHGLHYHKMSVRFVWRLPSGIQYTVYSIQYTATCWHHWRDDDDNIKKQLRKMTRCSYEYLYVVILATTCDIYMFCLLWVIPLLPVIRSMNKLPV